MPDEPLRGARPSRSTGEWLKTWGVIARFEATGEVGTAANKLSEDEARSVAIHQCALGEATDCKIYLDVETQPGFPPISAAHASLPKLVEFPIPRPVDHAVQVARRVMHHLPVTALRPLLEHLALQLRGNQVQGYLDFLSLVVCQGLKCGGIYH